MSGDVVERAPGAGAEGAPGAAVKLTLGQLMRLAILTLQGFHGFSVWLGMVATGLCYQPGFVQQQVFHQYSVLVVF